VISVVRYPDPGVFWRDARGFLERDESGNAQILASTSRHAAAAGTRPPVGVLVRAPA